MSAYPVWPTTPEGWCEYFKMLDKKFSTTSPSPLHHDNRCKKCNERR